MVRIDRQCALDHPARFAFQVLPVADGQRIGIVGQQRGVLGPQLDGLLEGGQRLGVTAQHGIRAPEHGPAVGIGGLLLQPRRQLVEHGVDLAGRERVAIVGGARRLAAVSVSGGTTCAFSNRTLAAAATRPAMPASVSSRLASRGRAGRGALSTRRRVDDGIDDAPLQILVCLGVLPVIECA